MKILFIGDIVSKAGRRVVEKFLPPMRSSFDFIIANGENLTHGRGMNRSHTDDMMKLGVDCFTGGNHTFENQEIVKMINDGYPICRPLNMEASTVGKGHLIIEKRNLKLNVISMMGRTIYETLPNPFVAIDEGIKSCVNAPIFVDFHAERTSEKVAFQYYLDGKVSAVVGTHTHVPTADARILPGGTGAITDVGMTGGYHTVIGVDKDIIINRFRNDERATFKFPDVQAAFRAVSFYIDDTTKKCTDISQIIKVEDPDGLK